MQIEGACAICQQCIGKQWGFDTHWVGDPIAAGDTVGGDMHMVRLKLHWLINQGQNKKSVSVSMLGVRSFERRVLSEFWRPLL